jgi:hypothetical protein
MKGGEIMKNHTTLNRSLVTAALIATVLFAAAPIANAQSTSGQSHVGFFQGLMQFIEKEFGLNQNQVQSAVQQYKSQRQATMTPRPTMTQQQMQARGKTRLDSLVASNKITAAQETAIISELSSVQSQYSWSSLQSDTPAQRKTQMQAMQSTLKTWAQSNNINPMYVMMFGGRMRGGKGMMGGHGNQGNWNGPTVTPTPGS